MRYYPLPNNGADRFANVAVFPQQDNQYNGRVDHKISNSNSAFGRAMYHHYEFVNYDGANPKVGLYSQFRDQYNVVLADTHTISPRAVNEFRFGYGSDESAYHGPARGSEAVQASGLQLKDLQEVYALPAMTISGFQRIGQSNQGGWKRANYYVNEALNYVRGKHNFRFGADIGRFNGNIIATSPSLTFGAYNFNGRFSGNAYADFLLGIMATSARSTSVGAVYPHRTNWAFYFTDDYKITPRLSLNFGLRYSLLDPGYVEQNLIASFDPLHNALVVPDEGAKSRIHPGFPKNIPIVSASSVGLGVKLARRDNNNFAPRIGFAWRPGRRDDFVVRGGAGLYYYAMQPYPSDGGGAPYKLRESFTNTITGGAAAFAFPQPFPTTGFVLGGAGASGMNPDLRTPYSLQYNFSLEKETLDMGISLSYVATLSRKNPWSRDLNQPRADTRSYDEKFDLRPFPYLFDAGFTENGGSHSYQAGILKAERKMKSGLFYTTHLTWAKSLGDDWGEVEDAFNRRRERSQGDMIPHWRFVASGVYELPVGRGKRFAAAAPKVVQHLIGYWSLSGTYVAQTGFYFTPFFDGVDPSNTDHQSGRPDRIANGNLPTSQRTLDRWFDTAAFVTPKGNVGRFGTSGAYVLEGPGLNVFHAGLFKDLVLHERFKARLEAVSTDFLNHPNFATPRATLATRSYGKVLGTMDNDGNRNFQLTLRVTF